MSRLEPMSDAEHGEITYGATPFDEADAAAVHAQLGRVSRGVVEVGHRCPCGQPDVLTTEPRLPDGTPFPTTYYATCPRLTGLISTLESEGVMKEMTDRLGEDEELRAAYAKAHEDYLARRAALGEVPEIAGISAGGMPDRVKCLHVLAGHALAAGPGVNPLGDETLRMLPAWWRDRPCSQECGPESNAPVTDAGAADVAPGTGEGADAQDAATASSDDAAPRR